MTEIYIVRDERPGAPPYYIQSKVEKNGEWLPVIISDNEEYHYLSDAVEEVKQFADRWQSKFEYQIIDLEGTVLWWKQDDIEIDLSDDFYTKTE